MNLGRKFCLFMYYVEQINNKQWMVKKTTTLNGSFILWSIPKNQNVSDIGSSVHLHCRICRKRVSNSYGLIEH